MLAGLRQSLTEYAIHVAELESLLMEVFATSNRLATGLTDVGQHFEVALMRVDEPPDLKRCEACLTQIAVSSIPA